MTAGSTPLTSRHNDSHTHDVLSDGPHGPVTRPAFLGEPSADLLDRACAGWERFLDSFEGASDE